MDPAPIGPDEILRRLAQLARSSSGVGLPRRTRDRWIVLGSAALLFRPEREYPEREINAGLQLWIAGFAGRMDFDAVSLRRALVDAGLLVRDPAGRRYRRAEPARPPVTFTPEALALDLRAALRPPAGATEP